MTTKEEAKQLIASEMSALKQELFAHVDSKLSELAMHGDKPAGNSAETLTAEAVQKLFKDAIAPTDARIAELSNRQTSLQNKLIQGHGNTQPSNRGPTAEDLKEFAGARIALSSLEEVAMLDAEMKGMTMQQYIRAGVTK